MKRFLVTIMLSVVAEGNALAADLPQPMVPPPQAPAVYAPPPPVYNWGGIYFGINGGFGFGNSDWSNAIGVLIPGGATSTGNFSISGGVVGATLGANVQADAFVFGVEGDFDASWIKGTNTSAFCVIQCETKNTWLSTLRARFGFAADRVLFYGTAGGAFGDIRAGVSGNGFTGFDKSTKVGWTAGAGIESAFADNWTARIEYLFVDLQNGSCSTALNCGLPIPDTVKFTTSLVRVGLDYKFRP